MMSKVKYVIDENVEQDRANYGALGTPLYIGREALWAFLSSNICLSSVKMTHVGFVVFKHSVYHPCKMTHVSFFDNFENFCGEIV